MPKPISTRHVIVALTESLRSLRWIPWCVAGLHKQFVVAEVWGSRRFCMRCGETLEVCPYESR